MPGSTEPQACHWRIGTDRVHRNWKAAGCRQDQALRMNEISTEHGVQARIRRLVTSWRNSPATCLLAVVITLRGAAWDADPNDGQIKPVRGDGASLKFRATPAPATGAVLSEEACTSPRRCRRWLTQGKRWPGRQINPQVFPERLPARRTTCRPAMVISEGMAESYRSIKADKTQGIQRRPHLGKSAMTQDPGRTRIKGFWVNIKTRQSIRYR